MAASAVVPPQEPAPLSEAQRLVDTFIAPSKTFTDFRRNASWWAPFLIIAVVSLSFIYVVDQKVGFRKVVENQIQLQPKRAAQLESLPADQREKNMALQVTITKIISYFVPAIALILYALFAGILFLTLKFGTSADIKYKHLFAADCVHPVAGVAEGATGDSVASCGSQWRRFQYRESSGYESGYFIGPDGSAVLRALLTPLDVITLWTLVLTAIGITCISKTKRGTAFAVVFGWYVLVLLVRVALAAATS